MKSLKLALVSAILLSSFIVQAKYYEIGGFTDSYIVSDSEREAIAQSIPNLNLFIIFNPMNIGQVQNMPRTQINHGILPSTMGANIQTQKIIIFLLF